MAYVWVVAHAWAVAIGLVIMGAATAVYFLAPHRPVNRRLGLMLLAQGFGFVASWGLANMTTDRGHATAWTVLGWMAYASLLPLYLLFVAKLRSPLTRLLHHPVATRVLWSSVLAAMVVPLVWTELFLADITELPDGRWASVNGLAGGLVPLGHGLLPLFGLLVAWDQRRRTRPGDTMRRQATVYLMAFGWRDLSWAAVLLIILPRMGAYASGQTPPWMIATMGLLDLVFVTLMLYGVLTAQLFDIDLKIKVGLEKSTVVALFAALVFIASEIIEQLLGVDQLVPAVLAAGVIALGMRPLVGMAARVVDRLMPGVADTEAYRTVRKREVYQAALQSVLQDGAVTDKERNVLRTLADQLGLSARDVRELEKGLLSGARAGRATPTDEAAR